MDKKGGDKKEKDPKAAAPKAQQQQKAPAKEEKKEETAEERRQKAEREELKAEKKLHKKEHQKHLHEAHAAGGNVMDDLSKKQVFKKYTYRGNDIGKLLNMNMDELSQHLRSRQRRRLKRNFLYLVIILALVIIISLIFANFNIKSDNINNKNSIITCIPIGKNRLRSYKNNGKIIYENLYKNE